ncbi:hypothetical protein GLOIN_2v1481798 [Rhizophagus irregularis DAOM 181602=DAOM 197198]|nr:hypothetical protein GLOIN_2v1481798 [Rhizophagus irregularis DAOM 181602=DAOM 197198]
MKPNISPHLFNIILRFIYCGNIELKNLQGPEAPLLEILLRRDDLNMDEIKIWEDVPNMKPKINVAPSRKPNLKFILDSSLIESNRVPLFASWIDRKDSSYNKNDIPYEFKLLYRSDRDGFNSKSFHINCDNKGATIWIAKIKDAKDISTAKLSYVNNADYAISCLDNRGPKMGNFRCDGTNDWKFCFTNDVNVKLAYPKIGIPESFMVESYEVFQVVKK